MSHAYARLYYHLIFSTKNRLPHITPDIQDRLYGYMKGIVCNLDGVVEEIGGIDDHVHLLLYIPPKLALSDAIKTIKANSSKWVHEEFADRQEFAWQRGYGIFTVSESGIPAVKAYTHNQAEHHRRLTFQEEFLAFLKKHGIEYDPRCVWD
jgi:REP element-mobilizing transposase RayT